MKKKETKNKSEIKTENKSDSILISKIKNLKIEELTSIRYEINWIYIRRICRKYYEILFIILLNKKIKYKLKIRKIWEKYCYYWDLKVNKI